jgi:hypothetical protein
MPGPLVRGLRSAAILIAVVVSAELSVLGRINTTEANPVAVDLKGVPVNDAGLADQVVSPGRADRHRRKDCQDHENRWYGLTKTAQEGETSPKRYPTLAPRALGEIEVRRPRGRGGYRGCS